MINTAKITAEIMLVAVVVVTVVVVVVVIFVLVVAATQSRQLMKNELIFVTWGLV